MESRGLTTNEGLWCAAYLAEEGKNTTHYGGGSLPIAPVTGRLGNGSYK